jgi:hypothetical protein
MPGRKITILSGPRKGTVVDVDDSAAESSSVNNAKVTGGNAAEAGQLNDTELSESTQASNAGRQAQSTDHVNGYL